ncbi:MAG: WD40/YVTN/BNR-like repeat-containing protein [Vicinamibacterales bacterium]
MTSHIACMLACLAAAALGPALAGAQGGTATGLLAELSWRSIGPGNFSGRLVDIEALDSDFRNVIVASASGGVWKSENAGTTWKPIFDRYGSASIGDVAVFRKDPRIVWVGTGEANNRNSVAWGDGVYRSSDGGETFEHVGLTDTYQIARIVLHPADPRVAWVAAIGNLWGYTGQRGLFKTVDGGRTWQKLAGGLPDDGRTGATDLVIDPSNPNVLYVAFYQRLRRPYRFDSGGPNGGIFKTTDGGRTWRKLTRGLPQGDTGRIGLAVYRRNPRIVMAIIEHGFQPREADPEYKDMTKLGTGVYRSEDGGASWQFVNRYNNRPFYYSQIRINPSNDQDVYLLTTSFRQSRDGGRTFTAGGPAFGPNYDYHAMWIDPNVHDRFFVGHDKGLSLTQDHGGSFRFFENLPVGQYYAIGVDMRDPYYIYGGTQDNGSWGGPSFARDAVGIRTDSNWKLHWGDGMHAVVDPSNWRAVYSSAENASLRYYDALTRREESRRPTPQNVVNYQEAVGQRPSVPGQGLGGGASPFRFNWQSPMILSPHNTGTLYLGGNYLFKSVNGGRSWQIVSPDLSNNDPETTRRDSGGLTPDNTGAETYATVVSLSESPIVPGLIWTGDDGNVHVTRDGGNTWTKVNVSVPGLPGGLWVSDVETSYHDPAVAYVAFDGHRSDNFETWVFKTSDYGRSWTSIVGNLPARQPVHVVTADRHNPDLLFLGTEFGAYVTLDGGKAWQALMNGMPTVAVHDLVIHPRDNDLIAATHGRGLFVLDDITPLQQLDGEVLRSQGHVFRQRTATLWEDQSRGGQIGDDTYTGQNPPSVRAPTSGRDRARIANTPLVTCFVGASVTGPVSLQIASVDGARTRTVTLEGRRGIVRYVWDGRFDLTASSDGQGTGARQGTPAGAAVTPGVYLIELTAGGGEYRGTLVVRADPLLTGAADWNSR